MIDLEKIITDYKPNQDGIDLLNRTGIVLVAGITGAGKNTVIHKLVETGKFHDLMTTISREPRFNDGVLERDGIDYHFVSDAGAADLLTAGHYVEVSLVHGRVYGLTIDELQYTFDVGKIAVADVDVQGVDKYRALSDKVTAIFLIPPSFEVWIDRLRQRYQTRQAFLADWPVRRESAKVELIKALSADYYNLVINGVSDHAALACAEIASRGNDQISRDESAIATIHQILDKLSTSQVEGLI